MKIIRMMCPESKYSIKCPYDMEAEYITVHNTANRASAKAEISYMIGNNNKVSYHDAVDDEEIVNGIEHDRNTWNAGDGKNGKGNRKSISIEICHSTNPDINKFLKAEKLAAKYIAYLLKQRNWGIERVKKHQDWSKKYCPHKTLDLGWERFLDLIRTELGDVKSEEEQKQEANKPSNIVKNSRVGEWQSVMNRVYGLRLAKDNSFGPDCSKKANSHQLYYKMPTIKNTYVGWMQKRLKELGYYSGKIDNSFGPQCQRAVRQFQKDKGLKVDGFAGANTVRELLR